MAKTKINYKIKSKRKKLMTFLMKFKKKAIE